MSQSHFGTVNPYPQTGEVLDDKYRIERLLGEGGMGAVAKATHLLRRAPVALKFMSPAVMALSGAVERFVNEGVAASQIDSDHVVKVFDVGRMPSGAPYLVMEFLEGQDLAQLLEAEGPTVEPPRAVHFALQMLRALHTAHAAGVVHRDMKPSNCFVTTKDGEPDFLKLVDFGISKVRTEGADGHAPQLTRTNSALGTPLYMSPEQARSPRDVDHRSDLYSVGAILYEMLSGRTPYTSESGEYTEILFKIFTTEPEPLAKVRPELSEALCAVVHRALLRERDGRFASAQEMAEALAPLADERSAVLLGKLRGARARAMSVSLTPSAPAAPQKPKPATARSLDASAEALRAPRMPTDVGVTRETASGAPVPSGAVATGRGPLVLAAIVMTTLLCAAAGVVAVRAHSPASSSIGHDPSDTTKIVAPPAAIASSPPAGLAPLPSAVPLASASASASASVSSAPSAAPAPVRPAANAPALPQTLGGLKLH